MASMRARPLPSMRWRLASAFWTSIRLVWSSMLAIGPVSSAKNGSGQDAALRADAIRCRTPDARRAQPSPAAPGGFAPKERKVIALRRLMLLLLVEGLGAPRQLLRRDVFLVGGDHPAV